MSGDKSDTRIDLSVPRSAVGLRLDKFLASRLPAVSRHQLRTLVRSGAVTLNGRRVTPGRRLATGDRVQVTDTLRRGVIPEPTLAVRIRYADAALLVADKPPGMPCLTLRPGRGGTLVNFLAAYDPALAGVGARRGEYGLAHRLDTGTSGLVVVGRDMQAYRELRRQFRVRSVGKEYAALVLGRVSQEGLCMLPLRAAGPHGRLMRCAQTGGQSALTIYRPVRGTRHVTLLRVAIPSGARHQIRVHLAALGHPIVGDDLYGSGGQVPFCLHAARLALLHPRTGRPLSVRSPLPPAFRATLRHHGLLGTSDSRWIFAV